jgi:hypothetical protein
MDHQEALRLGAAERYVLGELPAELRDQFEEHYFDCPSCAVDLKILTTFTTASRALLEEQANAGAVPVREERIRWRDWLRWLRPVIAAPAIAALAAIVILQAVGTIPAISQRATERGAQVYESTFRLPGATRGETTSKISVRPGESFALDFDFTPDRTFPRYQCYLSGPAGQTELIFDIAGEQANKELHVFVRGDKVHSGNYTLVFVALDGTTNSKPIEVQRIPFLVELQK